MRHFTALALLVLSNCYAIAQPNQIKSINAQHLQPQC